MIQRPDLVILTLNLAQLPYPLGLSGVNCFDAKHRASELCSKIVSFAILPDIITFQELFSEDAKNVIYDKFKTLYHISMDDSTGKYLVGVNSGLAILIRKELNVEVKQVDQYTYEKYRGIEVLTKKGVRALSFLVLGRTVHVFTTHIQSGGTLCIEPVLSCLKTTDKKSLELKMEQVDELAAYVTNYMKAYSPMDPVFITGDFNLENLSPGTFALLNNMGFLISRDPLYHDGLNTSISSDIRIIDYIFARKIDGSSYIVDYFGGISDHYALVGAFNFIS